MPDIAPVAVWPSASRLSPAKHLGLDLVSPACRDLVHVQDGVCPKQVLLRQDGVCQQLAFHHVVVKLLCCLRLYHLMA